MGRLGIVSVFALQLLPSRKPGRIKMPTIDRRKDGAAGFCFMLAVTEAAGSCQLCDIRKHLIDSVRRIGKTQFAHSRRVDQPAARQGRPQGARGGRVAAFCIILADILGQIRYAGQAVLDRRLADTRRADKGQRLAIAAPWFEPRDIFGIAGVDRDRICQWR